MSDLLNPPPQTPSPVADLQAIYGLPNQNGFGSAVFYERVEPAEELEQVALKVYRYFVGDLWDRFGEAAWMTPWQQVYRRKPGDTHEIIAEMRAIADSNAALLMPLLLDDREDAKAAQTALSAVYDDMTMVDLALYTLGDGAALSGILIAGRRIIGDITILIFLLD